MRNPLKWFLNTITGNSTSARWGMLAIFVALCMFFMALVFSFLSLHLESEQTISAWLVATYVFGFLWFVALALIIAFVRHCLKHRTQDRVQDTLNEVKVALQDHKEILIRIEEVTQEIRNDRN